MTQFIIESSENNTCVFQTSNQLTLTCLNSTIKTLEKGGKLVQIYQ